MRNIFLRHKLLLFLPLMAAGAVAWLIVRASPATETDIRRSACLVEGRGSLCLVADGDTVVLRSDTVRQQGVWINRHWWWPSCDGRVLTMNRGVVPVQVKGLSNPDSLRHLFAVGTDSLGRLLKRKDTERKELQYYLRSHGVIDEGYTQIAAYANAQAKETDSLSRLYTKLTEWGKKHDKKGKQWLLLRRYDCRVSWYGRNDSLRTVACLPVCTSLTNDGEPMIIHTLRSTKPWDAYAVRNVPWGAARHRKVVTVTLLAHEGHVAKGKQTILATGDYDRHRGHDLPRLFAADGSPVFTLHGRFIGIISGKEVVQ